MGLEAGTSQLAWITNRAGVARAAAVRSAAIGGEHEIDDDGVFIVEREPVANGEPRDASEVWTEVLQ